MSTGKYHQAKHARSGGVFSLRHLVTAIFTAVALTGAMLIALGMTIPSTVHVTQASIPQLDTVTVPSTTLGIWDGSPGTVPDGQQPDVVNDYLYYGVPFPAAFAAQAQAKHETALIEMEPWHGGGTSDCSSLKADGGYYTAMGAAIRAFGHPVIVEWGHEFNVRGQYPWASGNGCGFTSSDWKATWEKVYDEVKSASGGYAFMMWAPNADTCPGQTCTTADPTAWWAGPGYTDMTGVDGYPDSQWGTGDFAHLLQPTFNIIKALPGFSSIAQTKIFVAETDLSKLGGSGYESIPAFIKDVCTNGGDGVLQWTDSGSGALTPAQWTQLDTALATDCHPLPVVTPVTVPSTPVTTPTAPATVAPTAPHSSSPATQPSRWHHRARQPSYCGS